MTYRGYKIESDGTFGNYTVRQQGQGRVPNDLSGTYTSRRFAKAAIDFSLSNLVTKGKKPNAKEKITP